MSYYFHHLHPGVGGGYFRLHRRRNFMDERVEDKGSMRKSITEYQHNPPRYNLHELPKLIRYMRYTMGFHEEANAWERYENHYRRYEQDMTKYDREMELYRKGKVSQRPQKPVLCAEPNTDVYAEKRGTPKLYERPSMYQNAGRMYTPHQIVSNRPLVDKKGKNSKEEPQLVEVKKLKNVRSLDIPIPGVEIPADLSASLESE